MTDLYDGLERLAGPAADPTSEVIQADLARGRSALRRRRLVQTGGASAFAVAAVAAAVAFATAGAAPASAPLAAPAPAVSSVVPSKLVPTKLVAYQGEQPDAFELDQVPEGWILQGNDNSGLVLAPDGPLAGPSSGPDAGANSDPHSFVGKIAVMLQDAGAPAELGGKKVTVGENTGVLTKMLDQTDGWALFLELPDQGYLVIQVWDNLGWGETQVLEFAEGIHVNGNATKSVG
ncbi:hypothetical protein FB565_001226 [Actinoplanes lutulentus]|uniref:Uncharacterized protein n=1 Tax=Actinoplanes lutulentus TaxID=1287878 RepID=A0A327ZBQ7_9ACTN|nr:hypothetical protein [Actinoplanes lutulentus]MBB2941522.1 hypothetical protein [Actinoplanes lutulentus]RAK37012.1 hypothetical protein B0I29_107274 [Actinoplanes lutulentus]